MNDRRKLIVALGASALGIKLTNELLTRADKVIE